MAFASRAGMPATSSDRCRARRRVATRAGLLAALAGSALLAAACASSPSPASPSPGSPAAASAASAASSASSSPAVASSAGASRAPDPTKLDPLSFPDRTVTPLATYAVPGIGGLAATKDAIWSLGQGALQRIDPATGKVTRKVVVPGPVASEFEEGLSWLTYADGSLWATDFDTSIVERLDPETGKSTATGTVDHAEGILGTEHGLWVASHRTGSLVEIDPTTLVTVGKVVVGATGNSGPSGVWSFDGKIWTSVSNGNSLVSVDPLAKVVVATITGLPNPCAAMGPAVGLMWVAECGKSVDRVDTTAGRYIGQVYVGGTVGVPQSRSNGVWLPIEPPPNETTHARMLELDASGTPIDAVDLGDGCIPTIGPPSILTAFGATWIGCDNGTLLKLASTDLP